MARYQPRPSAAFEQVIECAGNCITRRLCCCAQGSTNRQARYQRQPSAAFAQGPGTRASAIAEQRHKQRGLKRGKDELRATRRAASPHRQPTDCRPTGHCDVINAASSAQGRQHIAFAEARCTTDESTRSCSWRTVRLAGRRSATRHQAQTHTSTAYDGK